jgi:hypothetical protein
MGDADPSTGADSHKELEVVMKSAYGRQTPPPDYELP